MQHKGEVVVGVCLGEKIRDAQVMSRSLQIRRVGRGVQNVALEEELLGAALRTDNRIGSREQNWVRTHNRTGSKLTT